MMCLHRFLVKAQVSNFVKIRPMEAELFHVDRQTDMTKLIVAFLNFANAPQKWSHKGSYTALVNPDGYLCLSLKVFRVFWVDWLETTKFLSSSYTQLCCLSLPASLSGPRIFLVTKRWVFVQWAYVIIGYLFSLTILPVPFCLWFLISLFYLI